MMFIRLRVSFVSHRNLMSVLPAASNPLIAREMR
jgi:hypothetical protein